MDISGKANGEGLQIRPNGRASEDGHRFINGELKIESPWR